jgi:DNA-binding response OmpR family regulator
MALRVLYIEDERDMLELVRLILSRRDVEFHGAPGGLRGLEMLAEITPDLVLLDLMMPDLSGWDVYDAMKQNLEWQEIPILIVTARAQYEERLIQVRAAANLDDYILKPFGPSQLLEVFDRIHAQLS